MAVAMGLVLHDIAGVRTFVFFKEEEPYSVEGVVTGRVVAPLDAVTGRVFSSRASVTRHPIESGADVTDHVIDEPDTIELTGVITNTPANIFNTLASTATRAEDYWEELLAARRAKKLLTVVSGPFVLENMILTSLTRTDDAQSGDSVGLQLRAEKVTEVESASVEAPTRNDATQNKKRNLGKKPTKPATPSQESSMTGKLTGWQG
jgi:hypothetical protein